VKWIVWIVVLGGLGALGWFGWDYYQKAHQKGPEYRTAPVTRGDVTQAVTASGQLNPVISVQVGSQISGMILHLYADFNSSITQGQVIAELDPATYRSAVIQADADVASAKAGLELAQLNAKRASELRKSDLIAVSENDKAVADLHQAEAQLMQREATLERAKVDLNRCTIYAPTNGIVISRNVDVGQTVAASLSAPTLFVIANNLNKMQIDAMVSEADIGGIEVEQPVAFTVDAFPTRNFGGNVVQIRNAPATNQNVVSYDTVIGVENQDGKLKPGMTANVSIITAQREGVLKIPNAALRYRPPEIERKSGPGVAAGTGGSVGVGGRPAEGAQARPAGPGGSGGFGSGREGGGGPRGGGGGPPGSGRSGRPRSGTRTVYTIEDNVVAAMAEPKPRQIRVGISDGTFTEVLDGLGEGEIVVVGSNAPQQPIISGPVNPFGGGGPRRF